jgi:hypothetical protein
MCKYKMLYIRTCAAAVYDVIKIELFTQDESWVRGVSILICNRREIAYDWKVRNYYGIHNIQLQ